MGWEDKVIYYGGTWRVDKLHSITTRQGIRGLRGRALGEGDGGLRRGIAQQTRVEVY